MGRDDERASEIGHEMRTRTTIAMLALATAATIAMMHADQRPTRKKLRDERSGYEDPVRSRQVRRAQNRQAIKKKRR